MSTADEDHLHGTAVVAKRPSAGSRVEGSLPTRNVVTLVLKNEDDPTVFEPNSRRAISDPFDPSGRPSGVRDGVLQ
jgi:hypothetical protein